MSRRVELLWARIGEGALAPSPVMRRNFLVQQALYADMFVRYKGRCVLRGPALQRLNPFGENWWRCGLILFWFRGELYERRGRRGSDAAVYGGRVE